MFKRAPGLQIVLDRLIAEQALAPNTAGQIVERLNIPTEADDTPWYIRGLIGLSGWFAAFFFVGALFVLDLANANIAAIVTGLVLCGLAIGLERRWGASVFAGQLALALSLAGQLLFIFGLAEETDSMGLTALLTVLLEAGLIALYPDKLHRFLSTLVACGAVTLWLVEIEVESLVYLFIILLAVSAVQLWQHESFLAARRSTALSRPIAYGLTVALFGLLNIFLVDGMGLAHWWLPGVALVALLVLVVYQLLVYYQVDPLRQGWWLLAGPLLLIIPAYQTPGIPAAFLMLLLGFQRGNRLLTGLAALFLGVFLIIYYYSLDLSLLTKSFVLMGTGLVLLGLWYGLKYIDLRRDEQ